MAIDHTGHGGGSIGGRNERGGALDLLIPVALTIDGLLLLLLGRGGGNLPGPGRRTGAGQGSRRCRWLRRRQQEAVVEASPAEGAPGPAPVPVRAPAPESVVEQLASFRDIGTWLSPGLAEGGALPGALR